MDNSLFPSKWKNTIYDEGDLLPVYIYRKRTWEDFCYFDKELPNKNNNNDKKIEDNKVDKENKENIPNNKPPKALASNEATQTLSIQEEEYSWTSDSNKYWVAIINHI